MSHRSAPELRLLHSVRLLGFADTDAIASRAGTSIDEAARFVRRAERARWLEHMSFADLTGWFLTESGRAENERQLAVERSDNDVHGQIAAAYREFLPLNARLLGAINDWQRSPADEDSLVPNDHSDRVRDGRILDELADLHALLAPVVRRLSGVLQRFAGYDARFEAALNRARDGQHGWIDRTDADSCHLVWFQLHEDLVATLGIDRRTEGVR